VTLRYKRIDKGMGYRYPIFAPHMLLLCLLGVLKSRKTPSGDTVTFTEKIKGQHNSWKPTELVDSLLCLQRTSGTRVSTGPYMGEGPIDIHVACVFPALYRAERYLLLYILRLPFYSRILHLSEDSGVIYIFVLQVNTTTLL
jgi:hypothetical protein